MKLAIVSLSAAAALTLGACSHMSETAAFGSVPVTSLTADQMRAELAAISEQLNDISQASREDMRRLKNQVRASALAAGAPRPPYFATSADRTVEGPLEWGISHNSPLKLNKVESLHKRQAELRAQLASNEDQG